MAVHRIAEFDLWRPGYDLASVRIKVAGTDTLANVYTDEALTVAAPNPQTLLARTVGNTSYGKFSQPLYTNQPYELEINSTDRTGIARPAIKSLPNEDASNAVVTPTGASQANTLASILARVVHALDFGDLGSTVSTNNTTLTNAIGAVAADGGGVVLLPVGTYPFTSLTLTSGVILMGHGRGVTTLQSQTGGNVLTLNGDRAGLAKLTLDGVDLQAGSVGVYSKANDELFFDDVDIRRFNTGMYFRGGRRLRALDLYVDNCASGVLFHGDVDSGGGADGDEFRENKWSGGRVTNCSTVGVELSFVDRKVYDNTIEDVGFENNTGTALNINGARFTRLPGCWWSGNTTNFAVNDDDDTDNAAINTVIGLNFDGGSLIGGAATFQGTCQDIVLRGMEISDVDFTLTLPQNNIVLLDCIEDSLVTVAGEGTKFTRARTVKGDEPGSSGVTSDNNYVKGWAYRLSPGQLAMVEASVVAVQRNGTGYASWHIGQFVYRPGSTLAYDNQTDNFTVGELVTGAVSGAVGRIIADSGSGSSGTLTLKELVGEFQDNEAITGENTGAATVNGTLSHQAVTLLGSTTNIMAAVGSNAGSPPTNWSVQFAAGTNGEVEIQVSGNSNQTVDWLVHAKVVV